MSKSSKIYQSLTEQQKQFVTDKTISATFKVGKWLSFLSKAAIYDQLGDKEVKSWTTRAIIGFVLAFISVFVAIGLEELFAVVAIVLFLALGIISLSKRKALKNKDISNYLRLFFIPVLSVLRDKAGEEAKLAATLDFRNPRKALKPETGKVGVRNLKLYKPKYIISKVKLKDQALLEFVIADDINDFKWTKRSASGKTKYKSKTKFVHYCFIKMTLPTSEYKWNSETHNMVNVIEHDGYYIAKMKTKMKTVGKDNMQEVKNFFGNMQLIYEQFQPLNPANEALGSTKREENEREGEEINDLMLMSTPYIWYGSSFSHYDYDSFDQTDSGDYAMDDDSATVFDS